MQGWFSKLSQLKPAAWGLAGVLGGASLPPIYQAAVSQWFSDRQAAAERTEKAVRDFRAAATDFDHLVATFVIALSQDDRVNAEASRRLLANILTQKQLLEAAAPLLPADVAPQVKAYEGALRALNSAIPGIRGVTTMREFWERTSDLVMARSDLYAKLRSAGA